MLTIPLRAIREDAIWPGAPAAPGLPARLGALDALPRFLAALVLWGLPALPLGALDAPSAVTFLVHLVEREPLLAGIGAAAAAVYVIATALLLAETGERMARRWRRPARLALRVALAPALLLSLAAWTGLATGCFFALMLAGYAALS